MLRASGAVKSKLQDEPALERRHVAQHLDESCEEAIEDQELPLASEFGARLRGRTQALLERLLKRFRRCVLPGGQAASPPKGSSATSTSRRSGLVTRPRRSACCAAWRSRS